MLTNETISKLNEMHLGTMASHFADQLTDPQFQSLSFEERFSILVDAEWSSRKSNRLAKLIKKAGYSAPGASIEDISFLPERKLDKAQILRLASCSYIQQAQNVIILGATGTGKTYLACALGLAANRNYYEVKYTRLPDLLVEIAVARGSGIYRELMRKYKKVSLLILDEWLIGDISAEELHFLFELTERRSDTTSTIFCTQYSKKDWIKKLGQGVYAEAIVDRYAYNTTWVETGKSNMREYCARNS